MVSSVKTYLIAACGLNCGLCIAHLREKNKCPGCRLLKSDIPLSITRCKIRNCSNIKNGNLKFCHSCEKFPCAGIRNLDKRYKTRYGISITGNLEYVKENGIRKFMQNEKQKWSCPECGGTVCMHKDCCFSCGKKLNTKSKENKK